MIDEDVHRLLAYVSAQADQLICFSSPERARPTGAVNRRVAFVREQVTVMVFKLLVLESRLKLMLIGSRVRDI